MASIQNGATSVIIRVVLKNKTTGMGLTGISSATSGLSISTICDNEATPVTYTQAGSTIEAVTTLGTYAAPTATKCRIKKVDDTAHPGLVEIQLADARFAVANAKRLVISINDGGSTILDADYEIELVAYNPFDSVDLSSAVFSGVPSLPGSVPALGTATFGELMAWIGMRSIHKFTQTATTAAIRNAADNADLFTAPASDNGTTFLVGPFS